ncbi:hypothetical protein H3N56_01240 [Cetobacterium sp. 2A]|uniref:hypothetical protein n=1 Tax=unclassified Cetobacterium TaxID=2630983 RepID=UPI00163CC2BC|nr:hypothetical protein [Cetobacterium sp. 2A]MBC2855118.1 hypothetical protein [Cetobacterium sp. 2A]
MKKIMMLLIGMTIGITNIYAKSNATVNMSAYVLDSATVSTVENKNNKLSLNLNELRDQFGQVERTMTTSNNLKIKKENNTLFVLDTNKNGKEINDDVVILTVINS